MTKPTFVTIKDGTKEQEDTKTSKKPRRRLTGCQICFLVIGIVIFLALLSVGILALAAHVSHNRIYGWCGTVDMPVHASCGITWTVGESCDVIRPKLISQITAFKGNSTCGKSTTGHRCLYKMESQTGNQVEASHRTPDNSTIIRMTFDFNSTSLTSCKIEGYSWSDTWYQIWDEGSSYCQMHNLITSAGFDKYPRYNETTTDLMCTQYSTANCTMI